MRLPLMNAHRHIQLPRQVELLNKNFLLQSTTVGVLLPIIVQPNLADRYYLRRASHRRQSIEIGARHVENLFGMNAHARIKFIVPDGKFDDQLGIVERRAEIDDASDAGVDRARDHIVEIGGKFFVVKVAVTVHVNFFLQCYQPPALILSQRSNPMEQLSQTFLAFIDQYGYAAVAVLMAMENACIPIPSELILGFAGYLIFDERMTFTGAMVASSIFAYVVGKYLPPASTARAITSSRSAANFSSLRWQ